MPHSRSKTPIKKMAPAKRTAIKKSASRAKDSTGFPMRLNAYLAHKGITTRRGADKLIASGTVFINGKKAVLGTQVVATDKVEARGAEKQVPYVYYAYNKPTGIVTTNAQGDEKDIVQTTNFPTKVFPVGRLDKDSHGLIIMTNDGRVTRNLLSPDENHEKEYLVKTNEEYNSTFLSKLAKGVTFDSFTTKPAKTKKISPTTFSITLTEGKKRQIRRMVSTFYRHVVDLKRIRIENIRLADLKEKQFRAIEGKELEEFLKRIKIT